MRRFALAAALMTQSVLAVEPLEWALPEGNYRVTIDFANAAEAAQATVFAESRRLMLQPLARPDTTKRSLIANIRTAALASPPENAPGASEVRIYSRERSTKTWDGKLTVDIQGASVSRERITVASVNVPTIYVSGDSTVADQSAEGIAGWGQMLPRFFRDDIAVANHAESGETLKSFLAELRLEKILSTLHAGDWLLIQFGHNDQKQQWLQTYTSPDSTYREYLAVFIAEARRHQATPILVTPPERRNFDGRGRISASLAEYADAMRAVAKELKVPLVDLNAASIRLYESLGEDRAVRAFADQGRDRTHTNESGAFELARLVVAGLRSADPELARHIVAEPAIWP